MKSGGILPKFALLLPNYDLFRTGITSAWTWLTISDARFSVTTSPMTMTLGLAICCAATCSITVESVQINCR